MGLCGIGSSTYLDCGMQRPQEQRISLDITTIAICSALVAFAARS